MTVGIPVGYSEEMLRTDYDLPGVGYLVSADLPRRC